MTSSIKYPLKSATIQYSTDTFFNLKRVNFNHITINGFCNGKAYTETVQFSYKAISESVFMLWWYEYKTARTVTSVHDITNKRSYVNIFDRNSSVLYHLEGRIDEMDVSYEN
ncbi:hypothetical protein [Heliothis virescens ascovirus 3e]|uniref:MoaF-like domain-containing protein n=2 Tax=Ascovirus hvav3a TaxID=3444724 RepID=A4KXA5_HVAVE|nr:hypothetical protein HVAV3e_gp049 [Heliothis virescens ascovirus 3e]YP_009702047.1 hypothetical protein F8204_gp054 [Heliothis virescens ascovirus 3g]ABO37236.1 hypothetical protein [Heliothis virescens ascovirus 3e]AFV50306.1 hypothetical protein [Heliothis virescens ascovirus 3g]AXN77230.1 hypothetical protein HvAV-3i_gp047 [Heliothis virescens ascovirus 3i]